MSETEKGHITGLTVSRKHLDALFAKYKGNDKATALLHFSGLLVQARAIHGLLRGSQVQPLIRDTFSALGAFVMERLGWTVAEFEPLDTEFGQAADLDYAETMRLRENETDAESIERDLREGQGASETQAALSSIRKMH